MTTNRESLPALPLGGQPTVEQASAEPVVADTFAGQSAILQGVMPGLGHEQTNLSRHCLVCLCSLKRLQSAAKLLPRRDVIRGNSRIQTASPSTDLSRYVGERIQGY